MKAFFDTSVLIAVFARDHERHAASLDAFLAFSPEEARCAAHSLAEVYATVTRLPPKNRVSGEQAMLFLETLRARVVVVYLDDAEYFEAIAEASQAGVVGGTLYDALIARCALKAGAEAFYTWNPRHFSRLHAEIAKIAKTP